jgi:hypothetical protein
VISERGLENLERDGWPLDTGATAEAIARGLDGRALAHLSWSMTASRALRAAAEAEVSLRAGVMDDSQEAPEFVDCIRKLIKESKHEGQLGYDPRGGSGAQGAQGAQEGALPASALMEGGQKEVQPVVSGVLEKPRVARHPGSGHEAR